MKSVRIGSEFPITNSYTYFNIPTFQYSNIPKEKKRIRLKIKDRTK